MRLWGASGEIHFTVSDAGAGFDLETALKSRETWSYQHAGALAASEGNVLHRLRNLSVVPPNPHARVPLSSGDGSVRAVG